MNINKLWCFGKKKLRIETAEKNLEWDEHLWQLEMEKFQEFWFFDSELNLAKIHLLVASSSAIFLQKFEKKTTEKGHMVDLKL